MKSQEFATDQVTETFVSEKDSLTLRGINQVSETFISHKDSLTVCGKASLCKKPKENSNFAMVSSILQEYVDLYISEDVDMNMIETEGEEETILPAKKIISKTLTIQDDKHPDSLASVSYDAYDLAELLEGGS